MTLDPHDLIARFGSPLYVYDLDVVRARARALKAAVTYRPFQPLYAIKANACPAVAGAIVGEGFGIDAVAPGEVAMALRLGVAPERVLYTENNMTDAEQAEAVRQGVVICAGSLDRLRRLAAAGVRECAVRFNPDVGAGAHAKIHTAGAASKFGVHHSQVDEVLAVEAGTGLRVVGCHMHIGSGSLDADAFVRAMDVILDVGRRLPHLRFVDFGGGIGIPYRPEERAVDLPALGAAASALMADFCRAYGRPLELRLEPGRFLVAEAGTLLTTVTSVKRNPDSSDGAGRTYVGCDTGFNHLIRPCMYDAYHRIENLTRPHAVPAVIDVVGNICESGDVFARDRQLPMPELGDVLAIRDAGAYGLAMASTYNLRPLPAEVAIDHGVARLARRRQSVDDLLAAWEWRESAGGAR
ncbi:MAG TPA: diaminopimelate decarboxylase [Planctomycetota bacterium]|nr:diaminopimelate decarboxylase [Planctomycetota bacterium]